MKTLLLSICAFALISLAGAAHAATCTAPGHASCTITCKQGCGAVYREPNGPCNTFCDDEMAKSRSARWSASTENLTHTATLKLMSTKWKAPGAAPAASKAPAKSKPK